MEKENRFIHKKFRTGDEAFENNDLSAAIQLYIMEGNADKLLEVSYILSEKGNQVEADKIYKKAHEIREEKLKSIDK